MRICLRSVLRIVRNLFLCYLLVCYQRTSDAKHKTEQEKDGQYSEEGFDAAVAFVFQCEFHNRSIPAVLAGRK